MPYYLNVCKFVDLNPTFLWEFTELCHLTVMRENFLLGRKKIQQHKEMITGETVKKDHSSSGGPTMIREHLPNESAPRTQGKMSN